MAKKATAAVTTKVDLEDELNELKKQFGDDAIRTGITAGALDCEVISTRCLALDMALGVGGIPRGRMTEIFGPESSGKTTLALTIAAEAQAIGGVAAMIDVEHALDPKYTRNIGVNLDDLLFAQPDSGEQALITCEKLIASNKIDVIIVDSVAALTPQEELDGELTDNSMAAQARLLGKTLRRLKGAVRRSKTCLIFINQLRDKIGMMMPGSSPDITPGGRALRFYASVRIDIRRIGQITTSKGDKIGNETKVKVVKNKVAPPFREANFQIIYGKGINTAGSLIDIGQKAKLIEGSASLSYKGNRLGLGKQQASEFLFNNPEIMKELDTELRSTILLKPSNGDVEVAETIPAEVTE